MRITRRRRRSACSACCRRASASPSSATPARRFFPIPGRGFSARRSRPASASPPIPGASALLAALTVSGLSAQPFYFAGFLPAKTGERGKLLAGLVRLKATLVFYEAPHRLAATLSELSEIFGPRAAGVARELTKLHETCERASLPELAAFFEEHPAKGECVILIAGASEEEAMDDAAIDAALREALTQHRLREAVDHVTALSQLPRSDIYARALALKEKK
ncbi:MAG: SAM-dependent methyltransferase [Alphaproteobacteria bacterium]